MSKRAIAASIVVALATVAGSLAISAPAGAVPMFSSCGMLRVEYPAGVAKSDAAAERQYRDGFQRPAVKPSVYRKNVRLDPDRDRTACEKRRPKPPQPIMVDIPLTLSAVTYNEYQGADVTYLKSRACGYSTEVPTDCASRLTDSAGTVIPTSSNPGDGLASAPPLAVGSTYVLIVRSHTPRHWSCSIYNPDGCSWISAMTYTLRWTFAYQGVDDQVIQRAELI